jgi:hypothetical protein
LWSYVISLWLIPKASIHRRAIAIDETGIKLNKLRVYYSLRFLRMKLKLSMYVEGFGMRFSGTLP